MATRVCFLAEMCPEVPDQPYQPTDFNFPRRSLGKTKQVNHSFQSAWFKQWHWLHYDAALDLAYYFICVNAVEAGKPVDSSLMIVCKYQYI